MPVLNFSPLTAVAVGPSGPPSKLSISPHSGPSTALVITAGGEVKENDFQWVQLGLTVASGTNVKAVTVCYQVLGGQSSYISQVRLTQMTTPNTAVVMHDDGTNLTSTTAVCYKSTVNGFTVNGTITLGLKIVIGRSSERIVIGGIALES